MANCVDQHSSRSPRDGLNHESKNLWEKNLCICCNKGEGVLVCSGSGCPVSLHAPCTFSEPKFDDLGNFYCPYCWYKRVLDKCGELRRKVRKAKEAFSSFLAKGVDASDKDGDELSLGGENRQDSEGKLQEAGVDPCEIALEDQADGDGDFRPFREEEIPVGTNLVQGSMNQEKFDEPDNAATDEIIFLPWKESSETEDSRRNVENVHEIGEEAEHLSALHMVKCTDGHSPDIAFAKGTQESVAKSSKKGGMTNKRKIPHRDKHVPAAGNSLSETNGLGSEDISRRKICRGKRKVQKTEHVAGSIIPRGSSSFPNQNWSSLIRRKKLFWSDEEQKALQDGVLRFSDGRQTIPWGKILESGSHVFHKTRTPIDLKDKWRNMILYERVEKGHQ